MPVKKKNSFYIVFLIIGFVFTLYFGMTYSIIAQTTELTPIEVFSETLDAAIMFKYSPLVLRELDNLSAVWQSVGICALIYILCAAWFIFEQQRKAHFKTDIAHGSTHWQDDMDGYNKAYSDPIGSKENNGPKNMILTENVKMSMETHKTRRNNNVTVVGGSGSGKSRFYVKPNILQANTNYVITDPSGELLESTGKFLQDQGYTIKVFNLVEMAKSNCYNPFDYIRDDPGVVMMIKCLIRNTTPPGQKSGDPFWEKSEEALLQAICFYLIEARPKKDRNFSTVMKLLRCAEINENDPSAESNLDKMFRLHEKENPNSLAVKQYKTFKMGAGKTLKSILISCSVRLTVFNLDQIASLTKSDENNGVELEKMGEGKRALFVIIPSADSTYNFLVSMMYSQMFETLYYVAETKKAGKRLDSPVRFLLDEFANIGEIPEFTKKLATMRKYDISCSIILQNLAQIKTMYKDDWQTILGNCDSFLFLGGQEYETVEYISKELGNATITVKNRSRSFGKSNSTGNSFAPTKRELMTPDELMRLDNNECILLIRGLHPFRDPKCKYENCKNYKHTADADKSRKYELQVLNQGGLSYAELLAAREKELEKRANDGFLISDARSLESAAKIAGVTDADKISVIETSSVNEAKRPIHERSNSTTSPVSPPFSDIDSNSEFSPNPAPSLDLPPVFIETPSFSDTSNTTLEHENNEEETKKKPTESEDDKKTKESESVILVNKDEIEEDEWDIN